MVNGQDYDISLAPTGSSDLGRVVESVAREKGIEIGEVVEAIESAVAKAGASTYGSDLDIRGHFDLETRKISISRYREVVEVIDNEDQHITLEEARKINAEINLGEFIIDLLPAIDFGRIATQAAKQVIVQKVREAEREHQYEAFKDRVGEIVSGTVKRIEFGNVIVDLGRAEAVLRREDMLGREPFRRSDRVRGYLYEVRRENRGPQIFLSRSHPQFIAGLFLQEVPEIYDSIIEIKSVATEAGSRAKISVHSNDSSIDPVGACVGMRGSRVQAVVNELQGQKIDIIPWSEDTATFIVNALTPAEVTKVIIDEEAGHIDVIVPDDQQSLAIGRRGQNVRLASILTGWKIDILTEAAEAERRNEEFKIHSKIFMDELDVDDVIAHLLVSEGFSSVEELAEVPAEYLSNIEEFDERIIKELHGRAQDWVKKKHDEAHRRRKDLGVEDKLLEMPHLSERYLVLLGEKNVKTLDNLADLASDELREIVGEKELSIEQANATIMEARKPWFADDQSTQDSDDKAEDCAEDKAEDKAARSPGGDTTSGGPRV